MRISKIVRRLAPRFWFRCKCLRYKFYNGEPEIWLLRHLLDSRMVTIDIGCSIGIYANEAARFAAKVVAIEANPSVASFAKLVAAPNVDVEAAAISSFDGLTTLRVPANRLNDPVDDLATIEASNTLSSFERIEAQTVQTRRLDHLAHSHVGLIKIDVEGHEEAVIDGAASIVQRDRPILMVELNDRFNPGIVARVTKRLRSMGYAAYQLIDCDLRGSIATDSGNFVFMPLDAKPPVLSAWERLMLTVRLRIGSPI